MRDENERPSVCLFGAALDTGNLGVSALGISTMSALSDRLPQLRFVLFDHGRGTRAKQVRIGARELALELRGGHISRRVYRRESLWTMYAASRLAPTMNQNVRSMRDSAAVLDISGGDSFTDLYGSKQLNLVSLPKRIALQLGVPLILLPQIYGPFNNPVTAERATDLLAASTQIWARDLGGYQQLQALLGDRFDPDLHRLGVDVAFALPATEPDHGVGMVATWLDSGERVVGVNVSGLLYNDPAAALERFGLASDYRTTMLRLVQRMLGESDVRILLVPHVHGGTESDVEAIADVLEHHPDGERVTTLPLGLGPHEIKHVIRRLDWFIGARMHATIAALSSRTPATGIAYSDKFQGVFDGCGVGHRVLDARRLGTEDLVDAALDALETSEDDRPLLDTQLVEVEETVGRQFDELAATIASAMT